MIGSLCFVYHLRLEENGKTRRLSSFISAAAFFSASNVDTISHDQGETKNHLEFPGWWKAGQKEAIVSRRPPESAPTH